MNFSLAITFCLILLSGRVNAHSGLAVPKPARKLVCRVGNNQPRDCHGPCPPMDTFGGPTGINAGNAAETWTRGEQRYVAWQKNNHAGKKSAHGATGFTRFALVPVDQMMSKDAHQRHAFWYTCWGAGETNCPSRDDITCGNDKNGKRYGTTITVPKNYKDGVYVLGYAWYGGGDYQEKSFFGDYWSCSFIRIQGGPYEKSSAPVFSPGAGQPDGGCWSAADRPGVCPSEPCHGKAVTLKKPYGVGGSVAGSQGYAPEQASAPQAAPEPPAPAPTSDYKGNGGNSLTGDGNRGPGGGGNGNDGGDKRSDGGGGIISYISLVNVGNGAKTTISGSRSFKMADFWAGVNVEAVVNGQAHVRFDWEGHSRTERVAPYALAGNRGNTFKKWTWGLPLGREFPVKITATSNGRSQTVVVKLKFY